MDIDNSRFGNFPAEHDNRHRLRQEPNSRESLAFMLLLPERGLAGFVYPTVNGQGVAHTSACIFGPGVAEPIFERAESPVPATMDFYDWHPDGVQLLLLQPHRSLDVTWRGQRLGIRFHYEALHPPYAFSSSSKGSPPYYGDDRTEQHGVITGELDLEGRHIPFKTFMPRDHSWGPRVWGLNQHYKWFHATTASTSIHFFEMQSFGRTHVQGYLFKDGLMTQIERVDYDFVLDSRMMHTAIEVRVVDELGRSASATCKTYADYRFEPDPEIVLNEAALTLSIAGEPGVGWCEFCWHRGYWEYARQFQRFM